MTDRDDYGGNGDATPDGTRTGGPDSVRARPVVRRRPVVAAAAVGLLEGLFGSCLGVFGGDRTQNRGTSRPPQSTATPSPSPTATTPGSSVDARALAERFAPDLHFDADERWFPTDPREFETPADGGPVVDGFTALDRYVRATRDRGAPPFPAAFYHVVTPEEGLVVVQYWFYSVFDQFTTNFHWHDWEVLYVWVDVTGSEPRPILYVGSAHARSMPNNEYLDPASDSVSVIAELGSHSSAIGVNRTRDRFDRYATGGEPPDVTNRPIAAVAGGRGLPLAYGLPRDEGLGIPYVVPQLDGTPLYEHERLPNLDGDALLPGSLAVDSLAELNRPPSSFPRRTNGPVFGFRRGDVQYDLLPITTVTHIRDFTGPQLSFPFAIPGFVEDRIASHISAADFPWSGGEDQRRFDEPIHDVTDPVHRAELARRYGVAVPDTGGTVVAVVVAMQPHGSAPTNAGIALASLGSEVVARFESDPVAVPSSNGHVMLVDVPAGDHRLVVNGPGYAPYAQRLPVDDGVVRAGAGGRLALVANAEAFKLRVDAAARGGAANVRVRDDFGGTVYDAPPVESGGRSAVYLHRVGAYVVEVTDVSGTISVERVRPNGSRAPIGVASGQTGKASVIRFVSEHLAETRREFADERTRLAQTQETETDFAALDDVARRLRLAQEAVAEAAAWYEEGFPAETDESLETALEHLDVVWRITGNATEGFPVDLRRFVRRRVQVAQTYLRQALALA